MFSVRLPCEELWDILLDEIDDTERGGVGMFGDRNVDGALAIDERVAEFDIGGVGDSDQLRRGERWRPCLSPIRGPCWTPIRGPVCAPIDSERTELERNKVCNNFHRQD